MDASRRESDVAAAAWLVLAVWALLACGGLLRPWLGDSAAVCAAFAAAAGLALALRRAGRPLRRTRAVTPARVGASALAFAAGAASLTAWIALLAPVGLALGLAPGAPVGPLRGDPLRGLALLALAPLFEELVYRERVIPALAPRLGATGAVVVSSWLFALPHLEPWAQLASFGVGLALGATFLATGSVLPCIGYHAGVNGAAVVCGVPPVRFALGPAQSALAAGLLLALALAWLRRAQRVA